MVFGLMDRHSHADLRFMAGVSALGGSARDCRYFRNVYEEPVCGRL